jgi:hypothetical protein
MSSSLLTSGQMTKLLTLIEEATRSTREGVQYFVEPAEDALRRATSRRHHIVFGRRGSGKSSLLRKAGMDLTRERRPMAWVDLEGFKGHSYPDLLISVLLKTLREFREWLQTAAIAPANKTSLWNRWFGGKPTRPPFDKRLCSDLVGRIDQHLNNLEQQLHAADEAEIETTSEAGNATTEELASTVRAGVKARIGSVTTGFDARAQSGTTSGARIVETYRRSKVEFLRRHVMDYQSIFTDMAKLSDGDSYLFLDDLYHLRRADQPLVVDYLHSIAKGQQLWLKIGTIRHRSNWYVHGSPPQGVKLGDDADEIDLDLTLEKYSLAKDFLQKVLQNLAASVGFAQRDEFLTDTGLDRLVLASGGVARDFLAVLRRAVTAARERGGTSSRGERVGAEDVNVAAGEYEPSKREEFKRDTYEEDEGDLNKVFSEVRSFCLDKANSNCFLLDKELQSPKVAGIHELVDLKLLHLIRSRVTVNTRQGRIYEAYMLDLSQYAGSRKKRDLDLVEFWRSDAKDQLRKASLIYLERGRQ